MLKYGFHKCSAKIVNFQDSISLQLRGQNFVRFVKIFNNVNIKISKHSDNF